MIIRTQPSATETFQHGITQSLYAIAHQVADGWAKGGHNGCQEGRDILSLVCAEDSVYTRNLVVFMWYLA